MERSELLAILQAADRSTLIIPEEKKQQIIANPLLKETLAALQKKVDGYRGTPILSIPYSVFKLFETTGDRSAFEGGKNGYFIRRVRMNAFALSSWLYGREEDISELEDILWAICDEYTWSLPAHLAGEGLTHLEDDGYMVDLFASETADALSEICFLLEDKLSPIIVKRCRHLVQERVLKRVLEKEFNWMHVESNWAAVCAGSVGMAAIYTAESDEQLCAILWRIASAFGTFLASFAEDGSCLEGIGYWTYGFSYYTSFAELLYRRTNGKIDMLDHEKVAKIVTFQQKCFFKGGRTVSFSDGGTRATFILGLACFLKHRFPDVQLPPFAYRTLFPTDGCGRWSNDLRNLLWADDKLDEDGIFGGCYPLPSAQWYIASSLDGNVGIAAKAGCNAEPHNHDDVGAFEIYKNGQQLIADLGAGRYSRQYFGKERYDFFCCSSRGHSTVIIGGQYQGSGEQFHDTPFRAKDVCVDEGGIRMDLADVYEDENLQKFIRTIRFDRANAIATVSGEFSFADKPETVVDRFVLLEKPKIGDGVATITSGGEQGTVSFDPAVLSASTHEEKNYEQTVYVLDLAVKDAALSGSYTITVQL